jgi:hypothetical protein
MKVVPITKEIVDEFVRKKHYSRRSSIFWAGFGLIIDGMVEGVCVFGQPSPQTQKHAFSGRDFRLYELSRLVVQTKEKNAASFLIAGSLSQLDRPCAVVSFADSEQAHCGIVYQATNWIYTGATVSHDHLYIIDGKRTHPMTLRDRGITNPKEWARENGVDTVKSFPKHRYFYICAKGRKRKEILASLRYPIIPNYPKCDQNRYDDGARLDIYQPLGKLL